MVKHEALSETVEAWLRRVAKAEKPPKEIIAYSIGLFETPDGYSAYLVGTTYYDDEDDWACDEAFTPTERYLPIARSLCGRKRWQGVLKEAAAAVRRFLETPAGRKSFLGKAEAVAVGFDDGDLIRVR
jgi:hypothetical protein